MTIPRFFARQPVLVNMFMIAVLVAGAFALMRLPMEDTPSIDLDSALIIAPYLGASPDDVEKLITLPIEEQIKNLPDVDFIWAGSSEGRAVFYIQYEVGIENFDQAYIDLKDEVDKVKRDLPSETADDLIFMKFSTNETWPIMSLFMGGDYSIDTMNQIAEQFQDELLNLPDVEKVDMGGLRDREIWIEADRSKLQQHSIGMSELVSAVQTANVNLPAGRVEMGNEEFLVRAMGEVDSSAQIGNVIVRATPDGKTVRVKDLAIVNDTYKEEELISRLNGKPSAYLRIFMSDKGSIVDVAADVRKLAKEFSERVPGVDIGVRNDRSKDVMDSINVLTTNAASGLILVALLMTLSIGFRSAILAVIGIPFSFLCAFIFLMATGGTINTLSLFALILVLGMVVDDAIIIIENVYRHLEEGKTPLRAAIDGTEQVMWPVVSAVLTTVAAFLPLLLMSGIIGKFLAVMPIVVAITLLGSLLESIVVLPSHLAEFAKLPKTKGDRFGDRLLDRLLNIYRKQLNFFLNHKYLVTVSIIIATVIVLIAAIKVLEIELFPEEQINTERMLVKLKIGTKLHETDRVIKEIESRIRQLPEGEINYISAITGLVVENQQWTFRGDGGMITLDLADKEARRTNDAIKEDIRERIKDIPELSEAYFSQGDNGPQTGSPVELRIRGDNKEESLRIAEMIADDLRAKDGVKDVRIEHSPGKKELRFTPDRVKMSAYGLTMIQLSTLLRTVIDGYEATKFREDNGDEVKVMVKYLESDRDELTDMDKIIVSTPLGIHVPLSELGTFSIERGAAQIVRYNAKRSITVTANVNREKITSEAANRHIREKYADFTSRFPGFQLEFGGQQQELEESMTSLLQAFIVAIILIYLILATQFQSFTQPLVVLFTVPFSILGVGIGLIAMNLSFSLVAGLSVVALSGVVVNDSLVLVDFVNKARSAGLTRRNALVLSGSRRMRPILLTTITTIAGLFPMAIGFGGASLTWQPMAICMIWGLSFATFLTLFVIPCAYAILDDILNLMRRWFKMRSTDEVLVSRAAELHDDTVLDDIPEDVR
jgi:multidrug efflux pump subunit AcrB